MSWQERNADVATVVAISGIPHVTEISKCYSRCATVRPVSVFSILFVYLLILLISDLIFIPMLSSVPEVSMSYRTTMVHANTCP